MAIWEIQRNPTRANSGELGLDTEDGSEIIPDYLNGYRAMQHHFERQLVISLVALAMVVSGWRVPFVECQPDRVRSHSHGCCCSSQPARPESAAGCGDCFATACSCSRSEQPPASGELQGSRNFDLRTVLARGHRPTVRLTADRPTGFEALRAGRAARVEVAPPLQILLCCWLI